MIQVYENYVMGNGRIISLFGCASETDVQSEGSLENISSAISGNP